jgi:uncharacterized protein (DUF2267 family)
MAAEEAEEADVTRIELSDRVTGEAAQDQEPDLPPRLAAVLDHLEEAAASHDGELANVLNRITSLPAEEDEPPTGLSGPSG